MLLLIYMSLIKHLIIFLILLSPVVSRAQNPTATNFDTIFNYLDSYKEYSNSISNAVTFIDKISKDQKLIIYEDVFDAYVPSLTKRDEYLKVVSEAALAQIALGRENEDASDKKLKETYPLRKALEVSTNVTEVGYSFLVDLQNAGQMDRSEFELRMQNFNILRETYDLWIYNYLF